MIVRQAGLGGLHELEHHRQGRGRAAGPAGDFGPQLHGAESALDGFCRAQVHPVLSGEVVEREELASIRQRDSVADPLGSLPVMSSGRSRGAAA